MDTATHNIPHQNSESETVHGLLGRWTLLLDERNRHLYPDGQRLCKVVDCERWPAGVGAIQRKNRILNAESED